MAVRAPLLAVVVGIVLALVLVVGSYEIQLGVTVVGFQSVPTVGPVGGAVVQITLRNLNVLPVVNLSVTLTVAPSPFGTFTASFSNVSSTNPLALGGVASIQMHFFVAPIRPLVITCGDWYPITVRGVYWGGVSFVLNEGRDLTCP